MAKKTIRLRLYHIVDYERRQRWLEDMHSQGWHLKSVFWLIYFFEAGSPEKASYRLEFVPEFWQEPDPDFLQLLGDYGWTYMFSTMEWRYYRKIRAAGECAEEELFSDPSVRVRQGRRAFVWIFIANLLGLPLVSEGIFFVPLYFFSKEAYHILIRIFNYLVLASYIRDLWIVYHRYGNKEAPSKPLSAGSKGAFAPSIHGGTAATECLSGSSSSSEQKPPIPQRQLMEDAGRRENTAARTASVNAVSKSDIYLAILGLVVAVVTFVGALVADSFLLHPIAPTITFDTSQSDTWSIDLSSTGTAFADAQVIDRADGGNGNTLVVEKGGQTFVLSFHRNTISQRWALRDAVPVEPDYTGLVEVGSLLTKAVVKFEGGALEGIYWVNERTIVTGMEIAFYFLISVAAAAAVVLPLYGIRYLYRKRRT